MDIATQSEIILRASGYDTWTWTGATPAVVCFENASLIGFIYIFDMADHLLKEWRPAQQLVLARHAPALRAAGDKAWNVYSVFLTPDHTLSLNREVEAIDEDFTFARKIARASIRTQSDLERALQPLTGIRAKPLLVETDVGARLRPRLKNISPHALDAFLGDQDAQLVAQLLGEIP